MKSALAVAGMVGATVAVTLASPAVGATNPLAPPSGSTTLTAPETLQGVQYARYSNASMTPAQVLAAYTSQLQSGGYQTVQEGGGGSGWSNGWGGGGGGLTAIKNGTYVSINAGGDGSPTYFEVCSGLNSQIVDNCQNLSQDAQNQTQSGGS
ncbi:MAG: hypothetical protein ACYC2Z_08270 [Candidatus Nanopelagicales bacterium]